MRTELMPGKPTRLAIDADWSGRKKALVGAAAGLAAVGAVALGVWAFQAARPLPMPRTSEQAIAVLKSAKFERLPSARKVQITAEARRLLGDLPPEQRRELFRDEDNRDAMRNLMEASFEETARRYARGEDLDAIRRDMGLPGGPGMRGPRDGQPRDRGDAPPADGARPPGDGGDGGGMTDEQREAQRAERMARFQERLANFFNTGSAQSGALRQEMFKRMRAEREASGQRPPARPPSRD